MEKKKYSKDDVLTVLWYVLRAAERADTPFNVMPSCYRTWIKKAEKMLQEEGIVE